VARGQAVAQALVSAQRLQGCSPLRQLVPRPRATACQRVPPESHDARPERPPGVSISTRGTATTTVHGAPTCAPSGPDVCEHISPWWNGLPRWHWSCCALGILLGAVGLEDRPAERAYHAADCRRRSCCRTPRLYSRARAYPSQPGAAAAPFLPASPATPAPASSAGAAAWPDAVGGLCGDPGCARCGRACLC